jgi:hypothetical protein
MDPLDDVALSRVKKFYMDRYGEDEWKNFERAMEARKRPPPGPEEVKGPPVSEAQAREREEEEKSPIPGVQGGTPSPGMIRGRTEPTRPTVPNRDAPPKDK